MRAWGPGWVIFMHDGGFLYPHQIGKSARGVYWMNAPEWTERKYDSLAWHHFLTPMPYAWTAVTLATSVAASVSLLLYLMHLFVE